MMIKKGCWDPKEKVTISKELEGGGRSLTVQVNVAETKKKTKAGTVFQNEDAM